MPKQKNQPNIVSDISETHHETQPRAYPDAEAERIDEVDESLSEIYQDDDGNIVDVSKFEKIKGRGFLFWFFTTALMILLFGGCGWYYYNKANQRSSGDELELSISADRLDVTAGQEFTYTIRYKNMERVEAEKIELKAAFPENFILIEASPQPKISSSSQNNVWEIGRLLPFASGEIKARGKLIGKKGDKGIVYTELRYYPKNFSSEFRKSASLESVIIGNGLDISVEAYSNLLVGEESSISITLKNAEESYLDNLRMNLILPEVSGIEIVNSTGSSTDSASIERSAINPLEWNFKKLTHDGIILKIPFKIAEKKKDKEEIKYEFSYVENGRILPVFTHISEIEVVKSDLNLSLVINGSRDDQGVNFKDTLHYSINYSNKGDREMSNVVIMAVIENDFVDWSTLKDENKGRQKDNMITWTKEEIPALATVAIGQEGAIDFSIQVIGQEEISTAKKIFEIKSYAYFNIGNKEEIKQSEDSKSNVVVTKINSNLVLRETLKYFNEDNIAVGTGPVPPKVGETTTYKVYWKISNNLHELSDLKVEVNLPPYVKWNEKNATTVGTVEYIESDHKVVWNVGRLPVVLEEIGAEFSVSVTPEEQDRNTVLVLLPGSRIDAKDIETNSAISKSTKAKTSKLEDDDIAGSDGRIQ